MAESPEQDDSRQRTAWHALSGNAALNRLESSKGGLSSEEASQRLNRQGPNRLREKQGRPWWRRLLEQFNNVLIIILLIAGAATVLLGQWVDAGAIFAVVLINAAIGFFQEGKAERALESIKGMLSPRARVIRDGWRREVDAEALVPGDVVTLSAGDRVPADLRLLDTKRLRVQEAPLTGESEAMGKQIDPVDEATELADRTSMAFAGTMAVEGSATAVVVETGPRTEIGRISEMLEEVEHVQTPLLRQLDHFARVLAVIIVGVATAMALYGVFIHGQSWSEMFLAAVGLAVAAIPQGLPALVTIVLALGVQRMARRNAIIRRLPAVETLGSVSTIYSDKTGTLTRNEMTLQAAVLGDGEVQVVGTGFNPEGEFRHSVSAAEEGERLDPDAHPLLKRFLTAGVLCNDADLEQQEDEWTLNGDPTEGAFVVAGAKAGWDTRQMRERAERIDAIPFAAEHKYMATLDQGAEGDPPVIHVKGAPEVVLERCDRLATGDGEGELDRGVWEAKIHNLSSRGYRVLAVADKPGVHSHELKDEDVESGLVLLGLAGLVDPPRDAAIEAVARCRNAGIRVKMVTGDHALTARAIAEQVGLEHTDKALSGSDIAELSDQELTRREDQVDVFARAAPEHKLHLVQAVQSRGGVCVMTGDGVNDAPGLKRADVGIAMGIQGTEAAKEAAEMVLADDNFASIANAVEEGRTIYDNIKKAITFLLPSNGGEALSVLGAVLLATALPITPVQILWINMVTAVTLGLALAFEPAEADVMRRKPRDPDAPILDRFLGWRVLFVSLLLVASVFGLFLWHTQGGGDVDVARTLAVNMLVAGEIVYLFNARMLTERSLSARGLLGSRAALIAAALVIVLQLLWTYTGPMQYLFESAPLELGHWGIIAAVAVAIFLLVEVEKAIWRRLGRR